MGRLLLESHHGYHSSCRRNKKSSIDSSSRRNRSRVLFSSINGLLVVTILTGMFIINNESLSTFVTRKDQSSFCAFSRELVGPLIKAGDFIHNSSNYLSTNYTLIYEKSKAEKHPILYRAAVCSIENLKPEYNAFMQHFPHLMQVLYPCIDYWLEYSNYTPILLRNEDQEQFMNAAVRNSEFAKGVLLLLKESKSFASGRGGGRLKMMSFEDYLNSTYFLSNQTIQSYRINLSAGFLFQHSSEWNEIVHDYYFTNQKGKYRSSGIEPIMHPQKNTCMALPRIGILNRHNTRSILNTEEILDELFDLYHDIARNATSSSISKSPPTVVSFEKATFENQANFFFHTDILVSVHGAQLTGISMMGLNPCAQILELFPLNYCIPHYFGSLAVQAGISHSYIYFDETVRVLPGDSAVGNTHSERVQARSANLCPSKLLLRNAVHELINDWRKCCHDHHHGQFEQ